MVKIRQTDSFVQTARGYIGSKNEYARLTAVDWRGADKNETEIKAEMSLRGIALTAASVCLCDMCAYVYICVCMCVFI